MHEAARHQADLGRQAGKAIARCLCAHHKSYRYRLLAGYPTIDGVEVGVTVMDTGLTDLDAISFLKFSQTIWFQHTPDAKCVTLVLQFHSFTVLFFIIFYFFQSPRHSLQHFPLLFSLLPMLYTLFIIKSILDGVYGQRPHKLGVGFGVKVQFSGCTVVESGDGEIDKMVYFVETKVGNTD